MMDRFLIFRMTISCDTHEHRTSKDTGRRKTRHCSSPGKDVGHVLFTSRKEGERPGVWIERSETLSRRGDEVSRPPRCTTRWKPSTLPENCYALWISGVLASGGCEWPVGNVWTLSTIFSFALEANCRLGKHPSWSSRSKPIVIVRLIHAPKLLQRSLETGTGWKGRQTEIALAIPAKVWLFEQVREVGIALILVGRII